MKILSIDIGIKNFAYCCIESTEDKKFNIIQWDVINLFGDPPLCSHNIVNKKGEKLCNKKASFCKDNKHYCKTHAKKTSYIISSNTTKLSYFRKCSITELNAICITYGLSCSNKKKILLETLDNFIKQNSFEEVKPISCNNISLIDVGIAIAKSLNNLFNMQELDKIIIENQISPIASRMKTIQGMVTQYFIMNNFYDIEFISAINKLKPYTTEKLNYNKRKKFSIIITGKMIQNTPNLNKWNNLYATHTKKDDLADSLLQGLWYLNKNNNIILEKNDYLT